MLFRHWVIKPYYNVLMDVESDALIIECNGSLMTSNQETQHYKEQITIVEDQTGIPFDALHNKVVTAFNEWIMKKEGEHN